MSNSKIVCSILLIFALGLVGTNVNAQANFSFYAGANYTFPQSSQFANQEVNPGIGFNLGGLWEAYQFRFTPVGLEIGLGFNQRRYQTISAVNDSGRRENFSRFVTNDIEIPILAYYRLYFEEFNIEFKGGLVPGLNVYNRTDISRSNVVNQQGGFTTTEELIITRPYEMRKLNLFTGVTFSRDYDYMEIGIQPFFQYNFFPLVIDKLNEPSLWTYGINVIVRPDFYD